MKPLLRNPVYHALLLNDIHLGFGDGKVKCFHKDVSPFAGFEEGYENGFNDLYELLPPGRKILYATPLLLTLPKQWTLLHEIKGLQFLFEADSIKEPTSFHPVLLQQQHVEQMMQLAALTKPGPFGPRTIEFGHYYGVFENEKLVAMTGQRLHIENFTEVSAVCTHPDFLGKGYASSLVQHQVHLILNHNQIPFLHVRADNERAIAVYERLRFKRQGEMNFIFEKMKTYAEKNKMGQMETFFVGVIMGVVLETLVVWSVPSYIIIGSVIVFIIIAVISYGFEVTSLIIKKGHYDIIDAVAGAVGGLVGMGVILLTR